MSDNKNNSEKKLVLIFPEGLQITADWIEKIKDPFLLQAAQPLVQKKNSILNQLITTKLNFINNNKTLTSSQELLSKTEKESGNTFMKNNSFDEAITHYTYSIIYNPLEPTVYANRALAYIRKEEYSKAILDSTMAIDIKKDYIKAMYRRAMCYNKIKQYKKSFDDLIYLINSNNNSQEIENELSSVLNNWKKDVGNENWKSIEKQLLEQISNARIQQLKLDHPNDVTSNELISAYNKFVESGENVKKQIKEYINKRDFEKAIDVIKICFEQCKKFKDKFNDKSIYFINILNDIIELNYTKILLENNMEFSVKEEKSDNNKKKKNIVKHENFYKTSLLSKEQRENATKIAEEDMNFTDFSKSSYGFEKAYNSFKDQEEKFFNFLIYFDGKTLAECYKNSEIPLNCLKAIINAFKDKDISNKYKDMYFDYFNSLTKTKAFGLVKNFIKKNEREIIKENLKKISETDENKKTEIEKLINKYK